MLRKANFLITSCLATFFFVLASPGYRCYEPNDIPASWNPQLAKYPLIGGIEISNKEGFKEKLNYHDEDSDPIIARILSGPVYFSLQGTDPNIYAVWTPGAFGTTQGTYYIDIQIEDIPPPDSIPGPLTDEGTLIVRVRRGNVKPKLLKICSAGIG